VLGGVQSLHTNALDEALALPTEEAATLALRTQQIIAFETGITDVSDPLGGSYAVERLTSDLEAEADTYIARIDAMGGMVQAIEKGYPQREIAESAYREQQAVDRGERAIVGVNESVGTVGAGVATLYIDDEAARKQLRRLDDVRARRDASVLEGALRKLAVAAEGDENTMPALLDAVRAYATLGEMCAVLRRIWGEYQEVPII
jgi:methylmalonyl-CoA mutase N-terminal domain/subunit